MYYVFMTNFDDVTAEELKEAAEAEALNPDCIFEEYEKAYAEFNRISNEVEGDTHVFLFDGDMILMEV